MPLLPAALDAREADASALAASVERRLQLLMHGFGRDPSDTMILATAVEAELDELAAALSEVRQTLSLQSRTPEWRRRWALNEKHFELAARAHKACTLARDLAAECSEEGRPDELPPAHIVLHIRDPAARSAAAARRKLRRREASPPGGSALERCPDDALAGVLSFLEPSAAAALASASASLRHSLGPRQRADLAGVWRGVLARAPRLHAYQREFVERCRDPFTVYAFVTGQASRMRRLEADERRLEAARAGREATAFRVDAAHRTVTRRAVPAFFSAAVACAVLGPAPRWAFFAALWVAATLAAAADGALWVAREVAESNFAAAAGPASGVFSCASAPGISGGRWRTAALARRALRPALALAAAAAVLAAASTSSGAAYPMLLALAAAAAIFGGAHALASRPPRFPTRLGVSTRPGRAAVAAACLAAAMAALRVALASPSAPAAAAAAALVEVSRRLMHPRTAAGRISCAAACAATCACAAAWSLPWTAWAAVLLSDPRGFFRAPLRHASFSRTRAWTLL